MSIRLSRQYHQKRMQAERALSRLADIEHMAKQYGDRFDLAQQASKCVENYDINGLLIIAEFMRYIEE